MGWPRRAAAGEPPSRASWKLPDIKLPTLGGKQFWTDQLLFHHWRIQHCAVTDSYRLLDGKNFQHASGDYVTCRAKLEEIKRAKGLLPMKGKVVIVLHGLFRSRASMRKLCEYLEANGGYTALNMSYASTQSDVASHARALDRIIRQLPDVEEINFVGHSMGNIVVRRYLHDQMRRKDGCGPDRRIKRFVMLGPPNHGSAVAVALASKGLGAALTGKAGRQLGREWEKLEAALGTPPCEFGIVAGGKADGAGFNPLLEGDDDGIVSVASARLAGARDFVLVPVLHSFLTSDPEVLACTLRFLQHGYFVAADRRQEIREDGKGSGKAARGKTRLPAAGQPTSHCPQPMTRNAP